VLELHPTTFNNKLSHDNFIEKKTQMSIQKKEMKDEKKCKIAKEKGK
jgi:hypothetical protein